MTGLDAELCPAVAEAVARTAMEEVEARRQLAPGRLAEPVRAYAAVTARQQQFLFDVMASPQVVAVN